MTSLTLWEATSTSLVSLRWMNLSLLSFLSQICFELSEAPSVREHSLVQVLDALQIIVLDIRVLFQRSEHWGTVPNPFSTRGRKDSETQHIQKGKTRDRGKGGEWEFCFSNIVKLIHGWPEVSSAVIPIPQILSLSYLS